MEAKKICLTGKKCHVSESSARNAVRVGVLFHNAPALEVYYCLQCYNWHLTSKGRAKATKRSKNKNK